MAALLRLIAPVLPQREPPQEPPGLVSYPSHHGLLDFRSQELLLLQEAPPQELVRP